MTGLTLFEKIWARHVVSDLGDGFSLLLVDRHLVNDTAGRGFLALNRRGLPLRHPELTFAVADHFVATLGEPARNRGSQPNAHAENLRENAAQHGFRLFDIDDPGFGIMHVLAGEQGLALPGLTLACGDSHTCTLGAVGSIAWGLGQSEVIHILATQTSVQRKPRMMRVTVDGELGAGVTAKDVILHLISRLGVAGGTGHAVEFAGSAIRGLSMEARFTLCNMAVELGARFGLIAPDETTFAYLAGRPYAPAGAEWDKAVADWRTLFSDADAHFDREHHFDAGEVRPRVSWGTNPAQSVAMGEMVPGENAAMDTSARTTHQAALAYSGLAADMPLEGTPVDLVFIGSCANARLSDLQAAAEVVRGRHVAEGVTAWVSPGSETVRRAAEAEGLDRIFTDAGFGWGRSGCSMCGGSGNEMQELAKPGMRVISTTNRNFVGRQGPGSRTHLASPVMAAAAAIRGVITDVRTLEPIDG